MLQISIIQYDIAWQAIEENLAQLTHLIEKLPAATNVVVLPEMFTTGFTMDAQNFAEDENGATITWLKKISKDTNKIITGSYIAKQEDKFYNRLVWMQPNETWYHYDKRHLFSYAGEDKIYTPGNKRLIVQLKGIKIALFICYDLRFPVWLRQSQSNEFDVMIIVANWPTVRISMWDALLKARAIENQCYVVACNRVGLDNNNLDYIGHSQVIDPLGNVLQAQDNTQDILEAIIDKKNIDTIREKFNFLADADLFKILNS